MKLKLVGHENDIKLPQYPKHWAAQTDHGLDLRAAESTLPAPVACRSIHRRACRDRLRRLAAGQGRTAADASGANLGQVSIVLGTSPHRYGPAGPGRITESAAPAAQNGFRLWRGETMMLRSG